MSSPLRLGCWLVSEFHGRPKTLSPTFGAGRQAVPLLRELTRRPDAVTVVVVGLPDGRAAWESALGPNVEYVSPTVPAVEPPPQGWKRLLARGRAAYNRYVNARNPDRLFAKLREAVGTAAAKAVVVVTSPAWAAVYAAELFTLTAGRVLVRAGKFVRRAVAWRPAVAAPAGEPIHPLAALASAAGCDVWWLPTPDADLPTAVPTVLTVPSLPDAADPDASRRFRRTVEAGRRAAVVACFNEAVRSKLVDEYGLPAEKVRVVETPDEWLAACGPLAPRVAAEPLAERVDHFSPAGSGPLAPRVAAEPLAERVDHFSPRRVCLILPDVVFGGLLEATKDLVRAVAAVNAERGQLKLSLAIPAEQIGADDFRAILPTEALRVDRLPADQLHRVGLPPATGTQPTLVVSNLPALAADAWLLLTDRVYFPFVPDRPYAVFVYDLIQERAPELFPPSFFPHHVFGIKPAIQQARRVLVTNPVTRADVLKHIRPDDPAVRLLPVACEPHLRFVGVVPEPAAVPAGFVLCVSNGSPHKGMERILRGYAVLRRRMGASAPPLVVCGINTDKFDPAYTGHDDQPPWAAGRMLVGELGLRTGQDVFLLGLVTDPVMLWLFENCRAVVNAAVHDNGSFNLIEGRYYGKPAVCTRYPAAEWLYGRFGVPVRYFTPDDHEEMAAAVEAALAEPEPTTGELAGIRRRLADAEFGLRAYADRVYEVLVELAEG